MLSRNASASAFIRANSSRCGCLASLVVGRPAAFERGDVAGKVFKAGADKVQRLGHRLKTHKVSDSGPAARCHARKQ